MNDTTLAPSTYDNLAHKATDRAEEAIGTARKAADGALDSLQDKASHLAAVAPGTLSKVAAQIDELTQRSMERARSATVNAREQASRASDRTVSYIKDEPVKSVLIAAAAGAAIAALIGLVARTKTVERY
jgi:ElaB/YqjD/DUF883 family membrane-anchored ribosome-binding protein